MEQTLGNRILTHRKRLGLTQDQLAEKLGVTAQAVSKWENDLSCPDITMLPKLAAIFGITTDILLGSAPEEPVTAAAVTVEDTPAEDADEDGDSDLHIHKGDWEFKWNSGRRGSLTIALLVLSIGGQLLAARLLGRDIGFWSITWTSAFLVFGFMGFLHRFRFWELGAMLVGAYFTLDNWSILPFTVGSELIFPLVILLFGLSLLLDAFKRPKKPTWSVKHHGAKEHNSGNADKKTRNFSEEDGHITYSGSFGDDHQLIALPLLTGGDINTCFGDFTIDLTGVEALSDPCELTVNTSFGDCNILVPRKFTVKAATSASFADVEICGHPDPHSQGVISVTANASFGDITIRYI